MKAEQIYTWRGQEVETLTKDELVAALKSTIDSLQDERKFSQQSAEMERAFAETRRQIHGCRMEHFLVS